MKKHISDNIEKITKILQSSIDSSPTKVAIFFKTGPGSYAEHDKFIGIKVPTLRKIAKNFLHLTLTDLAILIKSPINEERLLTLIILTNKYKASTLEEKEKIYQFYINNFHYINNWNLVDASAHLIMGAHLFGNDCSILKKMAVSQNMWERRIAIVATWYFIRKCDLEWTFKIAQLLLNDSHDLIHKAVGWMLREAGKKNESQLISFLDKYANKMPKTMLRYAIERLSEEQKMIIKNHN